MKIGIYGGSFNPVHNAHTDLANKLIEKNYLDKVIFVPVGSNYTKSSLASETHRKNMLEIIKEDNFIISDYEFGQRKYTIDTINHFKNEYINDEIYFIIGSDNLYEVNTWKNYEDILSNHKLLVIIRNNDDINKLRKLYPKYNENIIIINLNIKKISSTMVRDNIKNKNIDNIDKFIDEKVLKYIKENHLFERNL